MKKKVLALYGSPRKKGNSTTLSRELLSAYEEKGGTYKEFYLSSKSIAPCNACDACQRSADFTCVIKDDMEEISEALKESDILLLSSPIYCFTFSAQLKLFIDRTYALWKPSENLLKDKKIIIVLTYGDDDLHSSGAINAIRTFQDWFAFLGSEIIHIIHGSADKAGEIKDNEQLMNKARNIGSSL